MTNGIKSWRKGKYKVYNFCWVKFFEKRCFIYFFSCCVFVVVVVIRQIRLFSTLSSPVAKLLFSRYGDELIVVLSDSSYERFDVQTGTLLSHVYTVPSSNLQQEKTFSHSLSLHSNPLISSTSTTSQCFSASLSPGGTYLLTGTNDPLLRLWHYYHSTAVHPILQCYNAHHHGIQLHGPTSACIQSPLDGIQATVFSNNTSYVVSVGGDGIYIWTFNGKEQQNS